MVEQRLSCKRQRGLLLTNLPPPTTQRGLPLAKVLARQGFATASDADAADDNSAEANSNLLARCASVVGLNQQLSRRAIPEKSLGKQGARIVAWSTEGRTSTLQVIAVLDPISPTTQRIAPLLLLLRDGLGADVTVYLNPATEVSELPLKSYYRYAGALAPGASRSISIRNLPTAHTLTMKVLCCCLLWGELARSSSQMCAHPNVVTAATRWMCQSPGLCRRREHTMTWTTSAWSMSALGPPSQSSSSSSACSWQASVRTLRTASHPMACSSCCTATKLPRTMLVIRESVATGYATLHNLSHAVLLHSTRQILPTPW